MKNGISFLAGLNFLLLCVLVLFFCFSFSSVGFAGTCEETAFTQKEMNDCAYKAYEKAQKDIQSVLSELKKKISVDGFEKLKKLQELWQKYRDAQCDFETLGTETGSVHPMVHYYCLAGMTEKQKDLLEQQLNCEEGDLSCGGQ